MSGNNKFIALIVVTLLFLSCTSNDVYFQYSQINQKGWSKDTCYVFRIPVTDTVSTYNLYVNIRNKTEYPYQNMWLFLKMTSPDSVRTKDSLECYLADQRGKWLGSGLGSVVEMPVVARQRIRFKRTGVFRIDVGHGMRDSLLQGINDIGVRLEKITN